MVTKSLKARISHFNNQNLIYFLPLETEYTNILGIRAKQINEGAKPFVNMDKEIMDGYLIAQIEIKQKKLPFIIKRPIPNGGAEYWRLSDLEILL